MSNLKFHEAIDELKSLGSPGLDDFQSASQHQDSDFVLQKFHLPQFAQAGFIPQNGCHELLQVVKQALHLLKACVPLSEDQIFLWEARPITVELQSQEEACPSVMASPARKALFVGSRSIVTPGNPESSFLFPHLLWGVQGYISGKGAVSAVGVIGLRRILQDCSQWVDVER